MKVTIEIDMDETPHKLDAHLRGPEYKLVLGGIYLEVLNLLTQGHPYTSADAALNHLHEKMKKDASYFNVEL